MKGPTIGLVCDGWAAKTIRRKLLKIGITPTVLPPEKNIRIPLNLDVVIYVPKAISHGARDRAREWSAATGRPVICLAKNINLMPELRKAGILPPESPVSPPSPLSPEVLDCRRGAYGTIAKWYRALFHLDPTVSLDTLSTHPEWNPEKSPGHFSLARLAYREKAGLVPWSEACRGISRDGRRDLPLNMGPKAPPLFSFDEPEPESPPEEGHRVVLPRPAQPGRHRRFPQQAQESAPEPAPVVVTGKAALEPPVDPESRMVEIEEEIRTAAGMLREVGRRYGIATICVESWGVTRVSSRPVLASPEESEVVVGTPTLT